MLFSRFSLPFVKVKKKPKKFDDNRSSSAKVKLKIYHCYVRKRFIPPKKNIYAAVVVIREEFRSNLSISYV